ncbi:hypothetical protein ON010_g13089 [Phytophthora cinnamomi]|nr:hypothetical protein ON010_g13089 [Phytophthora cinnamomi]
MCGLRHSQRRSAQPWAVTRKYPGDGRLRWSPWTLLQIYQGLIAAIPDGAQEVAEAYMDRVFQRFGASEKIRHDRDPIFMGEVFARLRDMLGSRQTATLAYRPQANGQQERSVHTVIRAYVAEPDQSDWDDQVEKLMWALNTSFDTTRLDTPFYLVHGWDTQSTVSAMLGPQPVGLGQKTAYKWRRGVQRRYEYAQTWAKDLQDQAKAKRSESHAKVWWELSKRLKKCFEVHISRLKPRALFPDRPTEAVEVAEEDDCDAAILPEDVDGPDEAKTKYEVEGIRDVRWVKRTRTGPGLNCGALLYEFNKGVKVQARFRAMQAGDELPEHEAQ